MCHQVSIRIIAYKQCTARYYLQFTFFCLLPLAYFLLPTAYCQQLQAFYGHISLKVPNVKFDFDVSVDSMQLLTHASKTLCQIS